MSSNSVVNNETGGCDVTDTWVPVLATAGVATQKSRYIVNGLTGGCDSKGVLLTHTYTHRCVCVCV
jgi:hypothetical protein